MSTRPCLSASWPCWKKRMNNSLVSFQLADGSEMVFRVAGVVDLEDEDYAILEQAQENGALLVAKIIEDRGTPSFLPTQDEKVINAVMEKFAAESIYNMLENAPEDDCEDECCGGHGEECGCGHGHHHDGHGECGCGHEHHDDCGCGHSHGQHCRYHEG